jgi:hypothetical protein
MRRLQVLIAAVMLITGVAAGRAQAIDYINASVCFIQDSGPGYSAGFCPQRSTAAGPDIFRIRIMCTNGSTNLGPFFGPFREGGNYVSSAKGCPSTHPTRLSRRIEFF